MKQPVSTVARRVYSTMTLAMIAALVAMATACGDSKPPMVPDGPEMTPSDAAGAPSATSGETPSATATPAPSAAPAPQG